MKENEKFLGIANYQKPPIQEGFINKQKIWSANKYCPTIQHNLMTTILHFSHKEKTSISSGYGVEIDEEQIPLSLETMVSIESCFAFYLLFLLQSLEDQEAFVATRNWIAKDILKNELEYMNLLSSIITVSLTRFTG
jgi:hypothetical protein